MNYSIIILAAGSSTRFGKPKQLLNYKGRKLIQHIISIASESVANKTIVVLGAHHELISPQIEMNEKVHVFINEEWNEGIASSIRAGLKKLQIINPASDGAILSVCDQPFITTQLLNDLIAEKNQSQKNIVACEYENTMGIPVLFDKTLFPDLMELKGDTGAKKIIMQHKSVTATISFPLGNIDIDTSEEYQALMK
ncbi:MAG TPA: nucleotidyltransferase family protein [Puia sp.]|nr:nucleotidyltransferase family protein [Puia sp.]